MDTHKKTARIVRVLFIMAIGIVVGVAGFVYALVIRPWHLRRGAPDAEVRRSLPGDDLVPDPKCGYTQAITIRASVSEVWPWLMQIGYKRAGWYNYGNTAKLTMS
jgi:hypothetical protein